MTKNKLYTLLAIACFFGYIYIIFSFYTAFLIPKELDFQPCIFKSVTSYPCPSCGTTRAVKLALQGEFRKSVLMNPIGILGVFMLAIVPVWLAYDGFSKKETLLTAYHKTEKIIRIKGIAILLIVLIILNWIWNIYKQL